MNFTLIQTRWFLLLVFAWKRSWSCGCFYIAFFLFSEIRRVGWWRHFIHFWTHCLSTQCQGKWNSWRDVLTVMIAASKTSHKGPFIQNTVSNQSCQSRWKTLGSDLLQKKGAMSGGYCWTLLCQDGRTILCLSHRSKWPCLTHPLSCLFLFTFFVNVHLGFELIFFKGKISYSSAL